MFLSLFCFFIAITFSQFAISDFDAYWGSEEIRRKYNLQQKMISGLFVSSSVFAGAVFITGITGIFID
jgi:hypothetical protein